MFFIMLNDKKHPKEMSAAKIYTHVIGERHVGTFSPFDKIFHKLQA